MLSIDSKNIYCCNPACRAPITSSDHYAITEKGVGSWCSTDCLRQMIQCAFCHQTAAQKGLATLKKCGGKCALANPSYYCSEACQRQDWPTHKTTCNKKTPSEGPPPPPESEGSRPLSPPRKANATINDLLEREFFDITLDTPEKMLKYLFPNILNFFNDERGNSSFQSFLIHDSSIFSVNTLFLRKPTLTPVGMANCIQTQTIVSAVAADLRGQLYIYGNLFIYDPRTAPYKNKEDALLGHKMVCRNFGLDWWRLSEEEPQNFLGKINLLWQNRMQFDY
jgi:hypothetical protein